MCAMGLKTKQNTKNFIPSCASEHIHSDAPGKSAQTVVGLPPVGPSHAMIHKIENNQSPEGKGSGGEKRGI